LIAWTLDSAGLHRLELAHSTTNTRSCRVAARTGFRHKGTKRQEALHPDGWHDMHLHARLAADG
jgi:[ribosomal protein S5]-alanine N-acetyltransferase